MWRHSFTGTVVFGTALTFGATVIFGAVVVLLVFAAFGAFLSLSLSLVASMPVVVVAGLLVVSSVWSIGDAVWKGECALGSSNVSSIFLHSRATSPTVRIS